uniref:Si:dkey-71h2.2 n=1 Tax=Mastacembelus armatus TaxID=205130 RepID=A0A7N8YFW3_9TELE
MTQRVKNLKGSEYFPYPLYVLVQPLYSISVPLPENWTDTKETLLEGMVFNLKYLGMTLVGQPKGEDMASAAIRRIVATARAGAKKFRKVTLTVSPKGIIITDTETTDLIENVSIYRISYCTADKTQDKVFAYVSQSQFNETLECHAFLCQKKKIAQAVTLTVAQAFKVALDLWEIVFSLGCLNTIQVKKCCNLTSVSVVLNSLIDCYMLKQIFVQLSVQNLHFRVCQVGMLQEFTAPSHHVVWHKPPVKQVFFFFLFLFFLFLRLWFLY